MSLIGGDDDNTNKILNMVKRSSEVEGKSTIQSDRNNFEANLQNGIQLVEKNLR